MSSTLTYKELIPADAGLVPFILKSYIRFLSLIPSTGVAVQDCLDSEYMLSGGGGVKIALAFLMLLNVRELFGRFN